MPSFPLSLSLQVCPSVDNQMMVYPARQKGAIHLKVSSGEGAPLISWDGGGHLNNRNSLFHH